MPLDDRKIGEGFGKTPAAKKPGRPKKPADVVAEGLGMIAGGATPDEAADQLKAAGRSVSSRTLRRAAEGLPLPPGGAVSPRPDLLELVRRILEARYPAALTELDEGLAVHLRGDAGEFQAWLERPLPDAVLDEDPLVVTTRVLAGLVGRFERARTGREASGLAEKIIGAIGRLDQIARSRPKPQEPDAVLEELRRQDGVAIAKIEEHLADKIDPKEIA